MDILELLKTIQQEWALLVFFFTLGGCWWQGKAWFDRVNRTLDRVNSQHNAQNNMLETISHQTTRLTDKVDALEVKVDEIHDKVHEQEIKLAVLESSRRTRAAAK
jgi:uncharacterized protein YoxC